MTRPDFTLKWAGSRLSIPAISAGNYAAGWDTYLGPLPPLGDDHDYVMNLQDSRAIWLGEQMLFAVGHEWQDDITYDAYAVVRSPVNGQLYRSLVGSNLNNEPSVSGSQWALGVADSADLLNAPIATVAAAGTINLTTGAPDTSQLAISGTGASINGFTVKANRLFIVKMTGASNTLVNSASLVTGRGSDIPVVAGDCFLMRATADDIVEILCFVENPTPRASLASSGYQKLPSGLIIQWGAFPSCPSGSSAGVTLPIAFPNACLTAVTTLSAGANLSTSYSSGVSTSSLTQIFLFHYAASGVPATYLFVAIGY
jgi:hypothetical protein